jgi:hypothetical protein
MLGFVLKISYLLRKGWISLGLGLLGHFLMFGGVIAHYLLSMEDSHGSFSRR